MSNMKSAAAPMRGYGQGTEHLKREMEDNDIMVHRGI